MAGGRQTARVGRRSCDVARKGGGDRAVAAAGCIFESLRREGQECSGRAPSRDATPAGIEKQKLDTQWRFDEFSPTNPATISSPPFIGGLISCEATGLPHAVLRLAEPGV